MTAAPVILGTFSMVGEVFTLPELQKIYDISSEEAQSFRAFARIYPKDSTIIREGDTDKTLYLIRGGSVGIYKQVGDEQEMIARIDAVNFVGEMSCIIDSPRTATVKAITDHVLVYAISTPNFSLILSNPRWADILITRFSHDLNQTNTHLVQASARAHELEAEVAQLKQVVEDQKRAAETVAHNNERLVNIVLSWLGVIRDQATFGSRSWYFVKTAIESIERSARAFFPSSKYVAGKTFFKEISDDIEAIQKGGDKGTPGSVYEEIRKGFDQK